MLIKCSCCHKILNHVFTTSMRGIKNAQTNTYMDWRIKFLDYGLWTLHRISVMHEKLRKATIDFKRASEYSRYRRE